MTRLSVGLLGFTFCVSLPLLAAQGQAVATDSSQMMTKVKTPRGPRETATGHSTMAKNDIRPFHIQVSDSAQELRAAFKSFTVARRTRTSDRHA